MATVSPDPNGVIEITGTTTARAVDAGFNISGLIAIFQLATTASGAEKVAAVTRGLVSHAAQTNVPWTAGQKVYMTSAGVFTNISTANTYAGRSLKAYATTVASRQFHLNHGVV